MTPYDSEYATPKHLNCLDGTTFGIWYSVRGDGTDFNISTCLFNVTDEENTAPVIATMEVYTDTTCEVMLCYACCPCESVPDNKKM